MNKKNTQFVRRLLFSYSALFLIILIMGVYLYNISIENVSNEIRTQTALTLKKSVHNIDNSFKTMDVLASQIGSNSDIVHLANMPSNGPNEFYMKAYHAKEKLSVYLFTENLLPVISSFIYLHQTDYILSSSEFSGNELHYIGTRSYYQEMFSQWQSMLNDATLNRQFIPLDPYKRYSDSSYLYKLPLTEYSLKEVPANLCFIIDYSELTNLFAELNLYDTGYLYALDSQGNTVFSIMGDLTEEMVIHTSDDLAFENNNATFKTSGKDMLITTISSEFNNWQFYLIQPTDKALYSLIQYRNIFIAIVVAGLLFEVMLIFYLSKTNVKKITQLGTELQSTLLKQEDLIKIVEAQKPVIMQSYLRNIMRGNISTEMELNYAQQYLSIDSHDKKFSILYLTAYINQYEVYMEDAAVTIPEDTNYKELIQEGLSKYFQGNTYIFSPKEGEYALLISSDAQEGYASSNQTVGDAFNGLHNYLNTQYSIWTLAGLGSWHTGLMITWKSYQEAIEAISYTTKRDTFKCSAAIDRDTTGFYYPIELTTQLTSFITSGNNSQILEIFEIIRHENMEVRSLPFNIMKYLLSDVRNTLYKIRFTLKEKDFTEDDLKTIDALFDQHMSLKLCEDIAVKLGELYEDSNGNNKLVNRIRDYINENHSDPSLCLTKISDEFSISESYFSYLFKEEIGENFSNYLTRTRIEHAYTLLKATDINISEIFQEVGYNNAHSFRRAFKKIHGISPKDARAQLKQL